MKGQSHGCVKSYVVYIAYTMKYENTELYSIQIQVLKVISDQISIDIVTAIFNNVTNSDNIMQILDLTPKQYYSRCSRLSNIGIVSKQNGEMMLTSFGRLVYNAQMKIVTAFSHSSQLRVVDAIKSHSGLSEDQQKIIIDK